MSERQRPRIRPTSTPTCPLCRDPTDEHVEPLHTCQGCSTTYHHACAEELGGCATLGCTQREVRPQPLSTPHKLSPERQAAIRRAVEEATQNERDRRREERETLKELGRKPDPEKVRWILAAGICALLFFGGLALETYLANAGVDTGNWLVLGLVVLIVLTVAGRNMFLPGKED